ncbi:MarR family winged helix-turn-helix transcriptional regulator [Arthrobacter sp. Leaf234]|uniref:MarR family winged helix-turn-helix transcriptional regulator n=1 Tax=Arthrobacter sp. Leaf234 TaxID=1736303 RepID=UPI000A7B7497|nr:MarR family transcriptional regulator [Arthrobacter sp. Leaf234]
MDEHPVSTSQIDAMMRASRVLLSVIAKSLAEVDNIVTPSQLRVLVMIASRGPQTLTAVAEDLGVHPSNATRLCDRLVAAKLMRRDNNPQDRRFLQLRLTEQGLDLVSTVMVRRRAALATVLSRMTPEERHYLEQVMSSFALAAGEDPEEAMPAALGIVP